MVKTSFHQRCPPPRWCKGGLPAVHRRLTGGKQLLSPAMPPPRWRKGGLPAFHRRLTGGKQIRSTAMPSWSLRWSKGGFLSSLMYPACHCGKGGSKSRWQQNPFSAHCHCPHCRPGTHGTEEEGRPDRRVCDCPGPCLGHVAPQQGGIEVGHTSRNCCPCLHFCAMILAPDRCS